MPKRRVISHLMLLVCAAGLLLVGCSGEKHKETLRLLTWVGYDEPEFLAPLEEALGAKIEVTTYVGGEQMYTLFRTAPSGTYDAVVVDAEYGERMFGEGLLQKLDSEIWDDQDLFSTFQDGSPAKSGSEVYAAVMRWGALGLVFNTDKIDPSEASSYSVLWDPKVTGRVVVFDWYLPVMGVLSVANGSSQSFSLKPEEFRQLTVSLGRLRSQVGTIHPGTGEVIEDLRTGTAWLGPGIGEWAAAVLAEEGKPIDWVVPKEGGVMWIEGFAIPTTAKNPALAKQFIRLVREPEHLARLAWRDAYHSQVVRRSAYDQLDSKQRLLLKAQNLDTVEELIGRLHVRHLPTGEFDETDWITAWQRFKTTR